MHQELKQGFSVIAVVIWSAIASASAQADSGPVFEPLEIQYTYIVNVPWIYVRFSDGSMPGCHGNNSGMLYPGNANFDQVYAQILTMSTVGGVKGKVVYNVVDPGGGAWDDCTIDGLALSPSG